MFLLKKKLSTIILGNKINQMINLLQNLEKV